MRQAEPPLSSKSSLFLVGQNGRGGNVTVTRIALRFVAD